MPTPQAFIPILLVAFIVLYLFSKRKDKKAKTKIAWMLLISCIAITVAVHEFIGMDANIDVFWPFGLVAAICIIWLIALKTQK